MTGTVTTGGPFLISRGSSVGYQVVAAPGELIEGDRASNLISAVAGDAPEPVVTEIDLGGGEMMQAVYLSRRLTQGDLAPGSGCPSPAAPVLDEHGRPIEALYGFVLMGAFDLDPSRHDLDHCWAAVTPTLRAFFAHETSWAIEPTERFDLETTTTVRPPVAPQPVRAEPERPPGQVVPPPAGRPPGQVVPPPARRPRVAPVAAAVGLLLVVVLAIRLVRSGPDAPPDLFTVDVKSCELAAEAPTCVITIGTTSAEPIPFRWTLDPPNLPVLPMLTGPGCVEVVTGRPCTVTLTSSDEPGLPRSGSLRVARADGPEGLEVPISLATAP